MNTKTMQSCIDVCTKCYQVCLQTAMNHCLETGGKHVEPSHFRLMINCAQICQTSADLQLSCVLRCVKPAPKAVPPWE
jgi:hypothetical protein